MWKDLPYKNFIYASLALNVVVAIAIFLLKGFLPPVVPLFYGLPIGADQLVPTLGILTAPAAGIVISVVNIIISHLTNDLFLKKALVISSIFVTILITITITKIVLLVGFF
jgi:hypothetical protein